MTAGGRGGGGREASEPPPPPPPPRLALRMVLGWCEEGESGGRAEASDEEGG